MIPRVVFPLVLVALSFSLLVALAAEGVLDYLPPQPYFPTALRSVAVMDCDKGGQRWPAFGTSADFVRTPGPAISDFEADWYAWYWRAAQERSLYEASSRAETRLDRTLRFTWLRTFHAPVIVRVDEVAHGQMRLTAKQLEGRGGYGPGRIVRQLVRNLSPAEIAKLERALTSDRVLELPAVGCEQGLDGAIWIIDANDRGSYRFVQRWSPGEGPVRRFGDLMLGLTGWRLEPRY